MAFIGKRALKNKTIDTVVLWRFYRRLANQDKTRCYEKLVTLRQLFFTLDCYSCL